MEEERRKNYGFAAVVVVVSNIQSRARLSISQMAPAKANGVSVGEVACLTPYRLGAVLAYRASLRFLIRFLIGFQIHFLIHFLVFLFIF
jgi:hypothetical protein